MKTQAGKRNERDGRGTIAALGARPIALVGAGKLGEAILSGMLGAKLVRPRQVRATVAHAPRADYLRKKYRVDAQTNNRRAVKGAGLVLIVLKPQQVRGFLH